MRMGGEQRQTVRHRHPGLLRRVGGMGVPGKLYPGWRVRDETRFGKARRRFATPSLPFCLHAFPNNDEASFGNESYGMPACWPLHPGAFSHARSGTCDIFHFSSGCQTAWCEVRHWEESALSQKQSYLPSSEAHMWTRTLDYLLLASNCYAAADAD